MTYMNRNETDVLTMKVAIGFFGLTRSLRYTIYPVI